MHLLSLNVDSGQSMILRTGLDGGRSRTAFFIEEDSFCDSDSLVLLFRHLPGKCTMEKNLKFLKQQYSTVM